nr:LytTR family DNA-binding domain-containing protein [Cognatishimia sp. MH4019]
MSKPTGPRLWRRLPQALQTDVIRLSSDGHFVSVHTVAGLHRLRMRFADATAEMDNVEGGCVHRSHWIARAHVREVRTQNNRPLLVMSDGTEVPVSRTYRGEAERMGLLPSERKPAGLQTSRQA